MNQCAPNTLTCIYFIAAKQRSALPNPNGYHYLLDDIIVLMDRRGIAFPRGYRRDDVPSKNLVKALMPPRQLEGCL